MECPLSKEELSLWRMNPLSQIVLKTLENYHQNLQKKLSQGMSLNLDNLDRTGLLTAKLIGICEGISTILNMEPEEGE